MTKELLLLGILLLYSAVDAKNLLQEIKSWPSLSQVAAIIEKDRVLPALMETRSFTAFMPNDEAMNKYTGLKNAKLIHYHITNIPYKAQQLNEDVNTELTGNPRLYVTKIPTGKPSITGWEDFTYYINNAKIISANHMAQADEGPEQVLHIIDQVIAPTIAKPIAEGSVSAAYLNPDARKLLEKPNLYGLVNFTSITDFERRVSELNIMDVFNMSGRNTFFIPVNHALNQIRHEKDLIDRQVVHGHVVPNRVLFTRTVQSSTEQSPSLAFTDNLRVFISMEGVTSADEDRKAYYVKSNTVAGDIAHHKGTVLGRIVKANIPVKNGVVHLIDRPLMVVASSIMSYLQEEDGQLSLFHKMMKDYNPNLTNMLVVGKDLTLFAPSNDAFNMVNSETLDQLKLNTEKLNKLMHLHIIRRRLTTDEIVDKSTLEIFQEETMSNNRKLYFAVNDPNSVVPQISLEGGGVNATVKTPDIAAKNGVIHIIDRILGIPSQTVYEKLSTDPMLSATYNLSTQEDWSLRLNERDEKFTLFVPSDQAWDYIKRTLPSAFKKLFMGEFPYHVKYILERHMIVGHDWSLEELAGLTTNATMRPGYHGERLQMTRGKIYFQAKVLHRSGAKEYFIEWNGIRAQIIRPDVECVNGVVHVVDKVLMLNRDVTVSGSTTPAITGLAAILSTLITVAFARALHH